MPKKKSTGLPVPGLFDLKVFLMWLAVCLSLTWGPESLNSGCSWIVEINSLHKPSTLSIITLISKAMEKFSMGPGPGSFYLYPG